MVRLFAKEMTELKDEELPMEEIQKRFEEKIKSKELKICDRIARHAHVERSFSTDEDAHRFLEDINRTHKRIQKKKSLTYLVCVDGSAAADIAFQSICNMKKKPDHISLFFAYEPSEVPFMMRRYHPDQVQSRYVSQAIAYLEKGHYDFQIVEKQGRAVIDCILDYLRQEDCAHPPDVVVLGRTGGSVSMEKLLEEDPATFELAGGNLELSSKICRCYACKVKHEEMVEQRHRRGVEGEETSRGGLAESSLGCTADTGLRCLHVPVMVMKEAVTSKRSRAYVMAVDGSQHSKNGVDILLRLLRPVDSLRIIYVADRDTPLETRETIKAYYDHELAQNGPTDSAFVLLHTLGNVLLNVICSFVNDFNADFVALAPRATREMEITDLTEGILVNAKANVILCKN